MHVQGVRLQELQVVQSEAEVLQQSKLWVCAENGSRSRSRMRACEHSRAATEPSGGAARGFTRKEARARPSAGAERKRGRRTSRAQRKSGDCTCRTTRAQSPRLSLKRSSCAERLRAEWARNSCNSGGRSVGGEEALESPLSTRAFSLYFPGAGVGRQRTGSHGAGNGTLTRRPGTGARRALNELQDVDDSGWERC